MRAKFTLKLASALMVFGFGVAACAVDSSAPIDDQIFEDRLQHADVTRLTEEDLRQLPSGESIFVDLTKPDTGLVVEYRDVSLLDRIRVRDASGESTLANRMADIEQSGSLSRVILASDQELQMELVNAKAIPSLDPQKVALVCVCNECHMDGTILHCTGCVCFQD